MVSVAPRGRPARPVEQCGPMTRTHDPASNEAAAADRPQAVPRAAYRRFVPLTTRWMDNDAYGHLNNVVYYSLFDTAVNGVLIESGALDPGAGEVIGYVVETGCNYLRSARLPAAARGGPARGARRRVERALRDRHIRRGRRTRQRRAATSSTSTSTARPAARSPCPSASGRS